MSLPCSAFWTPRVSGWACPYHVTEWKTDGRRTDSRRTDGCTARSPGEGPPPVHLFQKQELLHRINLRAFSLGGEAVPGAGAGAPAVGGLHSEGLTARWCQSELCCVFVSHIEGF